jgi:hypothetical protein
MEKSTGFLIAQTEISQHLGRVRKREINVKILEIKNSKTQNFASQNAGSHIIKYC